MAAEQSQFSKLSKKQLILICDKLIDEGFPTGNPYISDYDESYAILSNIGKYFNIPVNDEDVQFFAKFLEINDDLIADIFANNSENINNTELINRLVIPVAKRYELQYSIYGSCTYYDNLGQKFDSYDKSWVRDSANQQRNDGNWDFYNGYELEPTYYDNFQEHDMSYDKVVEVDEKIQESLLSKLVIENTSEILPSLDKPTLLKLKQLIENKLRLL